VLIGGVLGSAGIRGMFREVVSTEFGLRTYSVPAQTGGSTKPKSVPEQAALYMPLATY